MTYINKISAVLKPLGAIIGMLAVAYLIFSTLSSNKATLEEKAQVRDLVISEIPVRVTTVEELEVDNMIELTGQLEARKELNIIAESQGRITDLKIEEGQYVTKGQVIGQLDDTNIKSQLSIAKASAEKAQKDSERFERLANAGAISQQQYEEVKLGLKNAVANVTSIEQQLKYSTALSPMSGIVKTLNVEQGSFATPGMSLATIVDATQLRMVVKVGESDIIKIHRGQKVKLKTDVYPDIVFNGYVKLISVQADAARKYTVGIDIKTLRDAPLKPGMYGVVEIAPKQKSKSKALFVARKAIVGSVQSPMVYSINSDQEAIYKTVKIGKIMGDKVEILHGLSEGESIVTSGQINLRDGQKIKVIGAVDATKNSTSDQPVLSLN